MSFKKRVVLAIPVRDEEARIGACLAALARQCRPADDIVLLLNNCTDGTLEICKSSRLAGLRIIECALPPGVASAGEARRLAFDAAAKVPGAELIFTTDADAVPPDDWIARNLFEFRRGAEVVCGTAHMDARDAAEIPERLHEDHRREAACLAALDELFALVDPDMIDPWPRHQQNSGASIAVTVAALARAGGAPAVASGEDRLLIERLRLVDARIRHADISVSVSGRLDGRAAGGMADTIKRRLRKPDIFADERIEPAIDAYRRALARARLRAVRRNRRAALSLGRDLLISESAMRDALAQKYFGAVWAQVQRLSPVLQRRRLRAEDLAAETSHAYWLREQVLSDRVRDMQFDGDEQIAG